MELNTPESKQLLQVLGPAEAWPGSGGRHRDRRDARPVLGRGQLPDGLIARSPPTLRALATPS